MNLQCFLSFGWNMFPILSYEVQFRTLRFTDHWNHICFFSPITLDHYYDGRCVYQCEHRPGSWAKAIVPTPNNPTIQKITYEGRHTCWKTQPMLTYQVRVTPGMGIECPPDGYSWREYDQRDIPGSRYPRYILQTSHYRVPSLHQIRVICLRIMTLYC